MEYHHTALSPLHSCALYPLLSVDCESVTQQKGLFKAFSLSATSASLPLSSHTHSSLLSHPHRACWGCSLFQQRSLAAVCHLDSISHDAPYLPLICPLSPAHRKEGGLKEASVARFHRAAFSCSRAVTEHKGGKCGRCSDSPHSSLVTVPLPVFCPMG